MVLKAYYISRYNFMPIKQTAHNQKVIALAIPWFVPKTDAVLSAFERQDFNIGIHLKY